MLEALNLIRSPVLIIVGCLGNLLMLKMGDGFCQSRESDVEEWIFRLNEDWAVWIICSLGLSIWDGWGRRSWGC